MLVLLEWQDDERGEGKPEVEEDPTRWVDEEEEEEEERSPGAERPKAGATQLVAY